jgi:hypothetical protein
MNIDFHCHCLPIIFLDLVYDVAPRYSPQISDARQGCQQISIAGHSVDHRLSSRMNLDEKRLTMDRIMFDMRVLSAPPYALLVGQPTSQPREDQEDEGYNEQKRSARYGFGEGP